MNPGNMLRGAPGSKNVIEATQASSELAARFAAIVGPAQVRIADASDDGRDWWPLALKNVSPFQPGTLPDLLVCPGTAGEVAAILRMCAETRTPVTAYGGGSGLVGSAIPVLGGVLLDLVRLRAVRGIDHENLLVTAEAGLTGSHLEDQLRKQGLTLGFYPRSLGLSSLGGWVSTHATSPYSGLYGGIEQRLAGLEVALADGTLAQTPAMPRWAVGPNLSQLFVGAEGTLGVVTAVTLKVNRLPARRLLRALSFTHLRDGLAAVRTFTQEGLRPALVRLYDKESSKLHRELLDHYRPGCYLLLGFDGPERLAELEEELTVAVCKARGGTDLGRRPAERWDAQRFSISPSFAALRTPGIMSDQIDIQAPWDRLEETYHQVREALLEECTSVAAHFSHVYDQGSSILFTISIVADDNEEAVRRYLLAWDAAMAATIRCGGAIAHQNGIGLARGPWLADALGSAWPLWERLKQAFDPAGMLNPGKLARDRDQTMAHLVELANP